MRKKRLVYAKNIFPGIIIHTARPQRLASTKICSKGNATNVYWNFVTHNIQFDIHSYLQTLNVTLEQNARNPYPSQRMSIIPIKDNRAFVQLSYYWRQYNVGNKILMVIQDAAAL